MARVITLTGPSGSGKSALISAFLKLRGGSFNPSVIPKYTTRPPREHEVELSPRDRRYRETIMCKPGLDGLVRLPASCDLVYEQYGVRYGLRLHDVFARLAGGKTAIVILNDIRTVEDIRTALGKNVRSVFVFRERPNVDRHEALARLRGGTDERSAHIRFQKAQSIYRIYIENIFLFDHVVLNHGSLEDLALQARRIVAGLDDKWKSPLEAIE